MKASGKQAGSARFGDLACVGSTRLLAPDSAASEIRFHRSQGADNMPAGLRRWVAAALCLLCGAATAAVVVGPSDAISGVQGLVVGETLYDVSFAWGFYETAFPANGSRTQLDASEAAEAANALRDLFEQSSVTGFDIGTGNCDFATGCIDERVFTPYAIETTSAGTTVLVSATYNWGEGWQASGTSAGWTQSLRCTVVDCTVWAVYTATGAVPEPGSLALAAAGLLGLALAFGQQASNGRLAAGPSPRGMSNPA